MTTRPSEIDLVIDRLATRIGELEVGIAVTGAKLTLALADLDEREADEVPEQVLDNG